MSYDNSIAHSQPVTDFSACQAGRCDDVTNNPMAMAEARSLAEQAINETIGTIESNGFAVSESPAQIEAMTQELTGFIMEQAVARVMNQGGNEEGNEARGPEGAEGGGRAGGGGTSIFERIALALGQAMVDKANELVELAESVPNAADGDVLLQSAQVTAAGQELNVLSQTFNSTINSVGQAASTAARKQ